MEKNHSDLLIVTKEEEGSRLDKILASRFKEGYSRSYFQYLIEQKLVFLNGLPVKKRIQPQEGDEVEIQFALLPEADLQPEEIPLDVIYEDDQLIAINKPVGMVVHPAPGNWTGTFVNALIYRCGSLPSIESSPLRPGIVHRIDKETSGILVAAKTLEMQQKLTNLFANRKVYKEYLAICAGHPPDGEIHAPIARHPVRRKEMAVVPGGKTAVTSLQTLSYTDKLSLVRVVIHTGRTHQIRVHLKYKGFPIIGDSLYGNTSLNHSFGANRQLLHAAKMSFTHPKSGKLLELIAPLPDDMMHFICRIKDCSVI